MSKQLVQLPITAFLVLPFRAMLDPFSVAIKCSEDTEPTTFNVSYSQTLTLPPSFILNSSSWTQILMSTTFPYPSELPEPDAIWFMSHTNGVNILDTIVLPRLNEFLLRIRRATDNRFGTEVLRSVGALDLVIGGLQFRGQGVFARSSATMLEMLRGPNGWDGTVDTEALSTPVPSEWATLVRATDLVNHGYLLEGFVIAFALLDALLQDFVRSKLIAQGLEEDAAGDLMRSIENDRLRRYLDLLLPLTGIRSPLDDPALKKELRWLNRTRNDVMHAGRSCTIQEAQRGLDAVLQVLRALNALGAPYVLPTTLPFWSRPKEAPLKATPQDVRK